MKLIESKTLGTAQASIEFTSIPQDGTDLVMLLAIREDTGGFLGGAGRIYFNDSTTGYSARQLYGNGSAAFSQNTTNAGRYAGFENGSVSTSNTFSNTTIYIPNYTAAVNKSWSVDTVVETNGTEAYPGIAASLWSNTAAITKITYSSAEGVNLAAGSIISLYKITKGSDGIVTTS
jgi:hypothetical protein